MTVIHEIAQQLRHAEQVICPGCNGNRYYQIGDRTVFCHLCCPAAEGQDGLSDCTSRHRNAAVAYWSDKRQVGWVVTLVGGPCRAPVSHQFHVLAGTRAAAIQTAKNNNHFVPTANLRCTRVRLQCPCDTH